MASSRTCKAWPGQQPPGTAETHGDVRRQARPSHDKRTHRGPRAHREPSSTCMTNDESHAGPPTKVPPPPPPKNLCDTAARTNCMANVGSRPFQAVERTLSPPGGRRTTTTTVRSQQRRAACGRPLPACPSPLDLEVGEELLIALVNGRAAALDAIGILLEVVRVILFSYVRCDWRLRFLV